MEPWGLGSRFGQWYLVGHDRARGDKRFFRLSRLTSAVTVLDKESFTPAVGLQRPRRTGGPGRTAGADRRRRRRARTAARAPQARPDGASRRRTGGRTPSTDARTARGRDRPPQRALPRRRDAGRGTGLLRSPGHAWFRRPTSPPPSAAASPPPPGSPPRRSRRRPSRRPGRRPSGPANAPQRTSSSGCCSWSRSLSTTRDCTSARWPPGSGSPARSSRTTCGS